MASFKLGKALKINDGVLNRTVENAMSRIVTKYKNAGEKANIEIREKSVVDWFVEAGFPISWHTMYDALGYNTVIHSSAKKISLTFQSFIDVDRYEIEHTRLYQNKEKYGNLEPFDYIVGSLQWARGIIGLPDYSNYSGWVNNNFHQTTALYRYTKEQYEKDWINTVKKYL